MTTTSQPEDYLITSSNTITLTGSSATTTSVSYPSGNYTVSFDPNNQYTTFTSGTGLSDTIVLTGAGMSIDLTNTFNWKQQEFVDCLPDISRVESMCKEYPGLKIAYDRFVTTYRLVKDDYDNPEKGK